MVALVAAAVAVAVVIAVVVVVVVAMADDRHSRARFGQRRADLVVLVELIAAIVASWLA